MMHTLRLAHYTNGEGVHVWQGMYAGMPLFPPTENEQEARGFIRTLMQRNANLARAPKTEYDGDTGVQHEVTGF